jgi:hypothetical protein
MGKLCRGFYGDESEMCGLWKSGLDDSLNLVVWERCQLDGL